MQRDKLCIGLAEWDTMGELVLLEIIDMLKLKMSLNHLKTLSEDDLEIKSKYYNLASLILKMKISSQHKI